MKILMVCLGNICRSPLAEGILQSKVNNKEVQVDSAGTAAYHVGQLPDKRSIAVAKKNGIDLTNQRARKFKVADFDTFDIIFTMDHSNFHSIVDLARSKADEKKVHAILNKLMLFESREVPDPYYGGEQGFENVYLMLDKACDEIAKKLIDYDG